MQASVGAGTGPRAPAVCKAGCPAGGARRRPRSVWRRCGGPNSRQLGGVLGVGAAAAVARSIECSATAATAAATRKPACRARSSSSTRVSSNARLPYTATSTARAPLPCTARAAARLRRPARARRRAGTAISARSCASIRTEPNACAGSVRSTSSAAPGQFAGQKIGRPAGAAGGAENQFKTVAWGSLLLPGRGLAAPHFVSQGPVGGAPPRPAPALLVMTSAPACSSQRRSASSLTVQTRTASPLARYRGRKVPHPDIPQPRVQPAHTRARRPGPRYQSECPRKGRAVLACGASRRTVSTL